MAIELITGLPGNGKTLYTIDHVRKWAQRENRQVFYHGIPELTLDWQPIEPTEWAKCPPGSIVVIDEAQKIFRNRSLGAQPPQYVQDLETHRHMGIDLVFLTQHPGLIDPAVRKLTQKHRHLVRIWGMEMSTVHTWHAVRDNCDKPAARKDSEKEKWAFNKDVYKLYKSAEVHTMKRSIPLRAKLLLLLPFVLAGAGYFVYSKTVGKHQKPDAEVVQAASQIRPGAPGSLIPPGAQQDRPFDPVADARNYLAMNTPRIEGLPHTAPKYDELTKPVRVPVPAMCIQTGGVSRAANCKCYTQQGTPMEVELTMCIGFARNGYFQDFDPERDREETARTTEAQRVMADRSSVHSTTAPRPIADRVKMFEYAPEVSKLTGAPGRGS